MAIHIINHRRQGGALAGACGANDQHQPVVVHRQRRQHRRRTNGFERGHGLRNRAQGQPHAALLAIRVGAIAPEAFDAEGKVTGHAFGKLTALRFRQYAVDDAANRRITQGIGFQRLQGTANPGQRRHTRRQMDVRCGKLLCRT